jgi:hypothetical protein
MGMMGQQATVPCYDNGTHGDTDGHIGPNGSDCPQGTYMYGFHGEDLAGHETNTVQCHVTVL